MLLVSNVPYKSKDRNSSQPAPEVILQTILGGGTAKYYVKNNGASDFSFVKDLTDVPEILSTPKEGEWKVITTLAAEVSADV